jgi:hypothetical protein
MDGFVELLRTPPIDFSHERVLEARKQLLQIIQEVITILKKTRKELSERHGVPVEESRRANDSYASVDPRSLRYF